MSATKKDKGIGNDLLEALKLCLENHRNILHLLQNQLDSLKACQKYRPRNQAERDLLKILGKEEKQLQKFLNFLRDISMERGQILEDSRLSDNPQSSSTSMPTSIDSTPKNPRHTNGSAVWR